MIQHEVTIHLNRPVEQVFAFLADSQNLRTWQSNLIENEQLTGAHCAPALASVKYGVLAPGSRKFRQKSQTLNPTKGLPPKPLPNRKSRSAILLMERMEGRDYTINSSCSPAG